jgi:uncharacterized membrane protein
MSDRNTVIRAANTLSLATWFGGSLMGAISLPRASRAAAGDEARRAEAVRAEGHAWSAWQPVQTGAIVSQLVSGAALTYVNRGRVAGQRGVASTSVARTALMGMAIGVTALAARSGRELEQAVAGDGGSEGGDPGSIDAVERRTRAFQAAVPVLTGALLVMDALMGEQQRPKQVLRGTARRVLPDSLADRLAA